MDITKKEQMIYLLEHTEHYIETMVYNVLRDSTTDPHYSAVTTSNLIKIYIDIMNEFGNKLPYYDLKSFFDYNLFTTEEYDLFVSKYKLEVPFYVGQIY